MAHTVDDSPKAIQQALADVKMAVGAVKKGERNSQQGFNFRGIDAVVNAAAPALNAEGVITTPIVLEYSYETIEIGQKRTAMGHVMVKVAYRFYGPAGDYIESRVVAESMDAGDKAMAKAMSVAYRIALLQTLNLPTDEPDPDSDSYERSGEIANPGRTTKTAPKAEMAPPANIDDLIKIASSAKTVEQLREAYKTAGAAGALQTLIADPGTGEKLAFQQYLTKRSDELSFRGGANGAAATAGAGNK